MSFRITSTAIGTQQIRSLPISATTGDLIRCDSTVDGPDTAFTVWCYFEADPGVDGDFAIFKTYSGTNTNHLSLYLKRESSGTVWKITSYFKGNSLAQATFPSSPIGKWYLLCFTHRNRPGTSADFYYVTIHDPQAGTTTLAATGVTSATSVAPTLACIGGFVTSEGAFNVSALGIFIPAILSGVFIVDGSVQNSVTTVNLADLATGKGVIGPIEYNAFASCKWAANFSAGAYNSANEDARTGLPLLAGGDPSGNLCVFDSGASVNPNIHQQPRGSTITGTILSVNPYLYGTMAYPLPTDVTVGSEALPATELTLAASGTRGPKVTKLANWINNGTGTGQLRVGIFGNSRAVYPAQYALRLSDGTYPNRRVFSNFSDMGIIGQAALWNDGRIIGGLFPVPTCQWSGTDQLEGAYGPDCQAALPRCLNAVPAVANPSVVLTSLVNSTLGSRFGVTSRTATTVPSSAGSADNYRGNGCGIRLSPGCTYRIMIRPENGLPVTDPLNVTLHITNYPKSSTLTAKKVVGASQSATEDTSSILAAPGLGASSANPPPTAKSITAVSAASLVSQVTQTVFGSVTVNDADNGFSTLEVGDMMQLQNSSDVSNVYNEAWVVRSVAGKGTSTCVITYQWLPRQAPIVGDKVTYIKAVAILQRVTASFAANEVAAGKWRGIEITAGATGDGVILGGLEFHNTTRDGVYVVPVGRSGCGAWVQAARWQRIEGADGLSLNERLFQTMDLDVFVATTADQGTPSGLYVESYDTLIDYVQADAPNAEIVVYATGPEWASGETNLNKTDALEKYDYAAVLQYAANSASVPMTAFLFSRFISAFGRVTTGDDITEGPTHPSCVLDITFMGQQLAGLTAIPGGGGGDPGGSLSRGGRFRASRLSFISSRLG